MLFLFFCGGDFLKFISFKTLRSLCIDFIIFLVPVTLLIIAIPFLLKLFLPFIIGFFLYLIARPLCRFLGKYRLPKGLSAALSLAAVCAVLFFALRLIFSGLFREIGTLSRGADILYSSAMPRISASFTSVTKNIPLSDGFKEGLGQLLTSFWEGFADYAASLIRSLSSAALTALKNIPSLLLSVFASVFTAFFLLKDGNSFFLSIKKFLGEKTLRVFSGIKTSVLEITLSYLKAQLIIESIIFCVLFIGFLILKIEFAAVLAFVTAIVDAVPILGTGTVLIPIAIFNFLSGNSSLGWGMLILYGTALLVRQFCEPKIVGEKLGIHPLATLIALFVGLKLFGLAGLILGPVFTIFLKNLIFSQ